MVHTDTLIQDQYGNYVVQHVLDHGAIKDKLRIVSSVKGKVSRLSRHKYASNVVEKCVINATDGERDSLVREVCGDSSSLGLMASDQYANYVIQKMMEVAEGETLVLLMSKLR